MKAGMGQGIRKIVFPAAGLATRFMPAAKTVPKELFPLVDKPLLQYAVEEAQEAGITEFIFITAHRKPAIEKHFSHLPELESWLEHHGKHAYAKIVSDCALPEGAIKIVYQDEPRGLGHAVHMAKAHVGGEPFAVLLPDDAILGSPGALRQMADFVDEHPGASAIAAEDVPEEQVSFYGIIKGVRELGHMRVESLVEKPRPGTAPSRTAIVGRYILQPRVFDHLEKLCAETPEDKEIQLTDAIGMLAREQPVYGYRFTGRRFDCGQPAGYVEANAAYALARTDLAEKTRTRLEKLLEK